MKQATKIISIIGAVFSFLGAVGMLIGMIVLFVLAGPAMREMLIKAINEGSAHSSIPGTPEEQVAVIQLILLVTAITLIPLLLCAIAGGVLALINTTKENSAINVTIIVLGVLTGNAFLLVAGIFGLITPNMEQPKPVQ